MSKQKKVLKELKMKLKDKKINDSESKKNNLELPNKTELKQISKMNKSPKGILNIDNSSGSIIDVKNATKTYVSGKIKTTILDNISLKIKKGELVAIMGASGSGKTTLLNILSGLDRVTSGDIVVGNKNISALSNSGLTTFRRNNIGFIFQSYNLLSTLNAGDNVEMGRTLQMDGNKRLNTSEVLSELDLKGYEERNISELSGGQKQRVSISRALAKNPSIIFADEPTGALDSKTKINVLNSFKNINKKYKTTIIIVTHDESVAKFANRIIRVVDGEIITT